jgi:hypothetical protein
MRHCNICSRHGGLTSAIRAPLFYRQVSVNVLTNLKATQNVRFFLISLATDRISTVKVVPATLTILFNNSKESSGKALPRTYTRSPYKHINPYPANVENRVS